MTRLSSSCILAGVLLIAAAAVRADERAPKVLVVGIDGLRADALDVLLAEGRVPNLQSLIDKGSYANHAQASQIPVSGPSWSDVLHGVHVDEHRVRANRTDGHIFADSNQPWFPDLFARVNMFDEQLITASFVTWGPLMKTRTPGGVDHEVFKHYGDGGDAYVTGEAVEYLAGHDPDVMFFYQADPDDVGHGAGGGRFNPGNKPYLAQIALTDQYVGQVLDAVRDRPTYVEENWLIVVTSDHGGSGTGHGQNIDSHRTVPFIVSGDHVPRQRPYDNPMFVAPKLVDVLPTVLAHLEVPGDHKARAGLRGHVRGIEPSVQPTVAVGKNLVFNGDAEYDRGFPNHGLDQVVSGWRDPAGTDGITVLRYDTPGGFPTLQAPGPEERGLNFFSAGHQSKDARISQTISLDALSRPVATGEVSFEMSAWLGGYSSQSDRAEFIARFLDAEGQEVEQVTLGPVTVVDRDRVTGLYYRETSGLVPVNTVRVEFVLQTYENDGYADNLSFRLTNISAAGL